MSASKLIGTTLPPGNFGMESIENVINRRDLNLEMDDEMQDLCDGCYHTFKRFNNKLQTVKEASVNLFSIIENVCSEYPSPHYENLIIIGKALGDLRRKLANDIAKNATIVCMNGKVVALVGGGKQNITDVANIILKSQPNVEVVINHQYDPKSDSMWISARSRDGGVNLPIWLKQWDTHAGGHPAAAGCTMNIDLFRKLIGNLAVLKQC